MTYDVFFLTYKEDKKNIKKNYQKLEELAPHLHHIDGIKGIFNAHKKCAELARTKMFYVVDGDCEVYEDNDFSWKPDEEYEHYVHNWFCKNNVNGLEYGYGGIKLFPRYAFFQDFNSIDVTTNLGPYFVHKETRSVTTFNTSKWNSWKAGFRECAKLTLNNDEESEKRLKVWMNYGSEVKYGDFCIQGAKQGYLFAIDNWNDFETLKKLNDFGFLYNLYKRR